MFILVLRLLLLLLLQFKYILFIERLYKCQNGCQSKSHIKYISFSLKDKILNSGLENCGKQSEIICHGLFELFATKIRYQLCCKDYRDNLNFLRTQNRFYQPQCPSELYDFQRLCIELFSFKVFDLFEDEFIQPDLSQIRRTMSAQI